MLKNIILNYMENKKINYAIYIEDLHSGEILGINEKKVVPSASIIKLFIMGKAFEAVHEGKLQLNDRISADVSERVPFSIIYNLDKENTYTVKDIITLMIIQSDNTAANLLIDKLGIEDINRYIAVSGFTDTVLKRKMMDFEARMKGLENYTTADDTALFLKRLYTGQLIDRNFCNVMLEILKMQLDNSMMRIKLEDDITVANKTGNLPGIKHDAGIVYMGSREYIFVMLTWGAKSDGAGRNVIGEVSKIVYDYMVNN